VQLLLTSGSLSVEQSESKIAQNLLRRNGTFLKGAHPQCGDSDAR